jgi:hypothetical protein
MQARKYCFDLALFVVGVSLFLATKVIEEGRDLLFSVGRPVVPDLQE